MDSFRVEDKTEQSLPAINGLITINRNAYAEKGAAGAAALPSSKILKRYLSVPILPPTVSGLKLSPKVSTVAMNCSQDECKTTPSTRPDSLAVTSSNTTLLNCASVSINIGSGFPRSNPPSREVSPAPVFNIFAPRARRYSASYSPIGLAANSVTANGSRYVAPRVSQLRQEECIDINSREVNHEREVHNAMQMSQSWEDLTLVAENWSCKSEDVNNPLQVVLPPIVNTSCSSPSPTSNRGGMRLPYGLSPSPTRRTFATRRSMSPIAMRPSQLGSVKRKFELDDNNSSNNWNIYSQPPTKKIFTESRGSSPICQSTSVCPSPDSGTYDGRITPKLFVSKLCTNGTNTTNSTCSSPISASPNSTPRIAPDSSAPSANTTCSLLYQCGSSSLSSNGNEPTCIGSSSDEGISVMSDGDGEKSRLQGVPVDMQDESTLMDDTKSETSSIGGCSSISIESSSCDSAIKTSFLNNITSDECINLLPVSRGVPQKHFFINKQGLSGAKKFIVNHENRTSVSRIGEQQQTEDPSGTAVSTVQQNAGGAVSSSTINKI